MTDPNIGLTRKKAAQACRRGRRPSRLPAALLTASLAVAFGLAGCGSRTASTAAATASEPTACPRVAMLADAVQVVQFRPGAGRDLSDVTARGTLGGFEGQCEYDDRSVTVDLTLRILAERGPASTENEGRFQYFVAITDPNGQILNAKFFDTAIPYTENDMRGGMTEELTQWIPLPGGLAQGRDYAILVGFWTPERPQITPP